MLVRFQYSVVLVLCALAVSSCATARPSAAPGSELLVEQFLETSGLSGLAVTVGTTDRIIWSQGFGYADLEQNVPIDPALTKFRVGSTAKSMTAVAMGQLYEAGKLDLDAPIQKYLTTFPQKSGAITSRLLAGHLAGIRHYDGIEEFLSDVPYESVIDALDIFADDPLEFPPGTEFGYSTYGFNLLSAVLERAAGESFLDYMAEYVFAPAGMASTVPDFVYPLIPHRSRYYEIDDGVILNALWVDNSNKWAGGGFLSTSEDLVRFGQAHFSDALLRPETIEMMWTSQKTTSGEETGYGMGWFVTTDDAGRRLIRHSGGSVGGVTELRIYPDDDLVIALITNTDPANFRTLAPQIAALFLAE
ncbi:MAG: serine hydrolase domain-containing protein [Pseudomonadota bacterium]